MNWMTIVFAGGITITRLPEEIFKMRDDGYHILSEGNLPSDPQVIVNRNNILFIRQAYLFEVNAEKERRGLK